MKKAKEAENIDLFEAPVLESDGLPSPEDMDKLARMASSPAFTRAKERDSKAPSSAAFKSQERVMNSMSIFYHEIADRHQKRPGYDVKIFNDAEELQLDCNEFVKFCMINGIIPTWNLLAVWLDVDMSTLYAEESLGSECSRVLKKFRNEIFTILEQTTLQKEGNPASGIFFMKSLWGLSDQQPLDVNVHMESGRQISGGELKAMIDLTPDEYQEK